MSENDPHENASNPAEDYKTPGGQPGDHDATSELATPETQIETPGGTTVTEKPVDQE